MLKKIICSGVLAIALAGASLGATVAPAEAGVSITISSGPSWGYWGHGPGFGYHGGPGYWWHQHRYFHRHWDRVCTTRWHHHHRVVVCHPAWRYW